VAKQSLAQKASRKHHYVTAAYLAQFTNNGTKKGLLCTLDFSTKKFFPAKPDDVAFEIDFNRIEVDGMAPDSLETALGRFEGQAIREIREICKTGKLPDMKSFSYIYNLITLFAVRNPALRNAALSSERHMSQVIMDLMTSSEEMYQTHLKRAQEGGFVRSPSPVSYKRMRDFIRRDEHTISIPTQRHIHTEFKIFPEMLEKVAQRYWSVMNVKPGAPALITCDRPAPTRLNAKTIVFTISPRHALLGASELYAPPQFEIHTHHVAEINSELLGQANNQIYSRTSQVALLRDDKIITCDLRQLFSDRSGK